MSRPAIELEHVAKRYPGTSSPAVGDLSLPVPEGEIAVLVGPSGCGKTTVLKMINRLIEPTAGRITVGGVEVRDLEPHVLRQGIGYVIQQVGLFPHRTVAQNIATVPRLLRWDRRRIERRVEELLELVALEPELLRRYPAELSGGQRQRVGVARALAADPPVLLMDEPFGAVDPIVRARLQEELVELQRRVRKTIVFVTHDIDEAIQLGDRVAILNVGGVLEQYAPPEEMLRAPASAFVEEFLGAERGLKRLSLMTVASVLAGADGRRPAPRPGPTAQLTDGLEAARRTMGEREAEWLALLDGERLRGWVWGRELAAAGSLAELEPRPFLATVQPSSSLREALDAIVSSQTEVAVVCEGDSYRGMLTLTDIVGEIRDGAPAPAVTRDARAP